MSVLCFFPFALSIVIDLPASVIAIFGIVGSNTEKKSHEPM